MDFKQIDYFIAVYETQNLHKAADNLFISQQGLSKSLRSLEEDLQTVLFERSQNGMIPTEAGNYFYEQVRDLKVRTMQIRKNVRLVGGGKVQLLIPCSYGILHSVYPHLKAFIEKNPGVHLRWEEVTDRRCEQLVLDGKAMIGLCVQNHFSQELMFTPLFRRKEMLLVYRGHRLFEKDTISYEDLEGEPVIMQGGDFNMNRFFREKCIEHRFYPKIIAETSEINFTIRMAEMKEGLGIVPEFIADMHRHADLRAIPFADPSFCWNAGVIYKKAWEHMGIYSQLIRYLQDSFLDSVSE